MSSPDARTGPLHLRVFVASPSDVGEERRLVQEVLEELCRSPAFRGLVTVEVFRYDDEKAGLVLPLNFPPQEGITRSGYRPADCDFTVALLWARLGTPLPPTETDGDTRPHPSGTAWEIEDALAAQKEVFLYVRSERPSFLQAPAGSASAESQREEYERVQTYLSRFDTRGSAKTGAIMRYSEPGRFREIFAQHMSGVLRRRLELAEGRRDVGRLRRGVALAVAAAAFLSAGWYGADRVWFDRPRVAIDEVESCEILHDQAKGRASLSFHFGYGVTNYRVGDAAYVEISKDLLFVPPLAFRHKQDAFSAKVLEVFVPVDPDLRSFLGWLRVSVKDDQQNFRGASSAMRLVCDDKGS